MKTPLVCAESEPLLVLLRCKTRTVYFSTYVQYSTCRYSKFSAILHSIVEMGHDLTTKKLSLAMIIGEYIHVPVLVFIKTEGEGNRVWGVRWGAVG